MSPDIRNLSEDAPLQYHREDRLLLTVLLDGSGVSERCARRS